MEDNQRRVNHLRTVVMRFLTPSLHILKSSNLEFDFNTYFFNLKIKSIRHI